MGKKKAMEPEQASQEEVVKPARKKGSSTQPKEAKKPVVKSTSPKATASSKAKTTATTPDDMVNPTKKVKVKTKQASAPKAAPAVQGESPKQKVKELKKQWLGADEKVSELKKAYKKLKKKEGKAKAKESMSTTLKTAKAERKTLKQAVKSAKKIRA